MARYILYKYRRVFVDGLGKGCKRKEARKEVKDF